MVPPRFRPWVLLLFMAAAVLVAACVFISRHAPPRSSAVSPTGDETKRQVVQDVIARRLDLLAAAAAFRDADADPRHAKETAVSLGNGSQDVGYCRSVIEWVRTEAPADQVDELTQRLEGELQAALRDGGPRLPEAGTR